MLDKLQNLIDEGTITIGQEDGLYDSETPILLDRKYLVSVEGFKVDADPLSLSERKYHVIVDFAFLNLTDAERSSKSNCILSDGKEDFHPFKIAKTEGDARFNRFDFVFVVPMNSRSFELTFNTGLDSIEKIRFKIDITSLEDKVKKGIPGGCMFFVDDPREPIVTQLSETQPL